MAAGRQRVDVHILQCDGGLWRDEPGRNQDRDVTLEAR